MELEESVISHSIEKLAECKLCGQSSYSCVDLSSVSDIIPLSYIYKNIGVKLKNNDSLPNLICKLCTDQIIDWQKFVQSCQEFQSRPKDR